MKFDLQSFDENKVFKNLAFIIASVFLIYPLIIFIFWGKWESGGLFGDSFGMITSLFSGVAVILLIITLIIQKKEYKITRSEFELSRKAQELSQQALSKQVDVLSIQQYDNNFFRLIDLHRGLIDMLKFYGSSGNILAKDYYCFKYIFNQVKNKYYNNKGDKKIGNQDVLMESMNEMHFNFYIASTEPCFNNLFYILTVVDKIEEESRKKYYVAIIKSILHPLELLWLFLYIMYRHLMYEPQDKWKNFVNKFAIFENIPLEEDFWELFKDFYEDSAFGV